MAKYKFKYWFEWGGTYLWSANDEARYEFGYAVDEKNLPIFKNLIRYLQYLLCKELGEDFEVEYCQRSLIKRYKEINIGLQLLI